MAAFDIERLHEMSAQEFVTIIKSMSDKEIRELMSGSARGPVLEEILSRLPQFYRGADGLTARMNLRVDGGPGGSHDLFAVVLDGAECRVERDPQEAPTASIKVDPAEFGKLLTDQGSPMIMALRGKISVRGDLAFAQKFSSYFDIPKD